MPATFEELAARELDDLYQAALFLKAGEEGPAEELLVDTMTRAVHSFRELTVDVDASRWLEILLVRRFLHVSTPAGADVARGTAPLERAAPTRSPDVLAAPEAAALCRAAGAVPATARAALWLVLLRRWRYADAAEAMRLGTGELHDLLRHRDAFAAEVLRSAGPRSGTGGTSPT